MCRPQEDNGKNVTLYVPRALAGNGMPYYRVIRLEQASSAGFSQLCASLGCTAVIRLAAGDHVPSHEVAAELAAMPALDVSITDGDRFVLLAVADELVYPRPSKVAAASTISTKATQDASFHVRPNLISLARTGYWLQTQQIFI
jgi:hypothetical protein